MSRKKKIDKGRIKVSNQCNAISFISPLHKRVATFYVLKNKLRLLRLLIILLFPFKIQDSRDSKEEKEKREESTKRKQKNVTIDVRKGSSILVAKID